MFDGRALLQRLPWSRGQTFESICHMYVAYVTNRYGKAAIVFDGYEDGPAIMDATHWQLQGTKCGIHRRDFVEAEEKVSRQQSKQTKVSSYAGFLP